MLEIILPCLLIGAMAGFTAGLFGIGGGLILVPFLAWLYTAQDFGPDLVMVMAVATSLATIIITAISSVAAHHRRGAVDWKVVSALAPGILVGAAIGSSIAHILPGEALRILFGLFLLYVAAQMAFEIRPEAARINPGRWLLAGAGAAIGAVSAILGIGGGTLTVPLMVKCAQPMAKAVAIAAACGLPIAVSGTLTYMLLGWDAAGRPAYSLGYIHLPPFLAIIATSVPAAPWGAQLAHQLPTGKLKKYFAALLALVAVRML